MVSSSRSKHAHTRMILPAISRSPQSLWTVDRQHWPIVFSSPSSPSSLAMSSILIDTLATSCIDTLTRARAATLKAWRLCQQLCLPVHLQFPLEPRAVPYAKPDLAWHGWLSPLPLHCIASLHRRLRRDAMTAIDLFWHHNMSPSLGN